MRQDQPVPNVAGRRFVVLRHEVPDDSPIPSHWDLLIEAGHSFLTWRLWQDWATVAEQSIQRIGDHRLDFLEFEGPLTGGRGCVGRVDSGELAAWVWCDREIAGAFRGRFGTVQRRLFRLESTGGADEWRLEQTTLDTDLRKGSVMIARQPWFERSFPSGLPGHLLPVIVERLRGTPARLEERLRDVPQAALIRRLGETWSIQENAGHLSDVEPLWSARVDDLAAGRKELAAADLQNRRTHDANHNQARCAEIVSAFRSARRHLVQQLESFPPDRMECPALHPRLKSAMNVSDLAYFVAEHDDYHMARISELLREFLPGSDRSKT